MQTREFEVSGKFPLTKSFRVSSPGGRAAILTFHSGEDRLVKQATSKKAKRWTLYSDVGNEDPALPMEETPEKSGGRDPRRCAGRSVRERIPIEIKCNRR